MAGWDGDRWVLAERDDGETSLSYAVVWESEGARDRFVDAVHAGAAAFAGPVSVESFDVGGRAASMLTIGATGVLVSAAVVPGG